METIKIENKGSYYIINPKWVRNKYVLPFVIINLIYKDFNLDPKDRTIKEFREELKGVLHNLVYCLEKIIKLDNNPINNLGNGYDPLETLDYTRCFINIEDATKQLNNLISNQIDIRLSKEMVDMMDYVPEFDTHKVKLSIPSI